MNNFRIVTVNGRMQTADAAPEIDLAAQRIALRKMLHGEVAFHDDPQSGKDLADAIPAAVEHAAACVGPDGVAKFFEGYMPEQAKGAKPVAWVNRHNLRPYWLADGCLVLKATDGHVVGSEYSKERLQDELYFTPIYPGDPRLVEWGLAEPAAQPVALEGVVYESHHAGPRYRVVGAEVEVDVRAQGKWKSSLLTPEEVAGLVKSGHLKPINVAAQASNETTAAQEQSQVSATPDSEGWIAHTPGECPVAPDVQVEVRTHLSNAFGRAGVFPTFWREGFITHYRIVSGE